MLTDAARQRSFPSLEGVAYLNTAAEGVPPLEVGAALDQYFRDKQLGMDGRVSHFAALEEVKSLTAEFYGLTAAEVGVCSCTSEAYNLAALALRLRAGDEVVVNDLDFPAGVTPWLQAGSGAEVRVWKSRGGRLHTDDLKLLLTPRTRLVATSLVSFYNGFQIPLDEVTAAVRHHSTALIAVDVTQALGRIPLKLAGVDWIVSSTHKWILASHGGGLVGVPAHRAREWTVPAGGWHHLEDAFGPNRFEAAVSKPGAASFAVGMPNFPAIYAIRAALAYLKSVGAEAIDAAARPLTQFCLEEVAKLPVDLLTPRDPHSVAGIFAFRHSAADAIAARLRERNIHIMCHAGRLRVAIHGYNTAADVDRFLRELHAALRAV